MSAELKAQAAFVIHRRAYKEHNLIAELLSLNLGRICVMARASKKSPIVGSLLQPFTPVMLTLSKSRSSWYYLSEAAPSGNVFHFAVPEVFCAMYANELLYYLYKEQGPAPKLFAAYLTLLQELSGKEEGSSYVSLRKFEFALLEALGFGITFNLDKEKISKECLYHFSLGAGFSIGADPHSPLAFTGEELLKLKAGNFEAKAAKRLTGAVLEELLSGRPLQSRELYADFLNRTKAMHC